MPKETNQITFALSEVKVDRFSLTPGEKMSPSKIIYDIGLERGFDLKKEVAFFSIPIQISYPKKDGEKKAIGNIKTTFSFHILDMKKLTKDDKINIPKELMGTFVNIAYATTRGILFERSASTSLGNLVLPLVSPVKLLELTDPDLFKKQKEK